MHLSRQSEPLYRELAKRLRQELLAYRPGDYLPGEIQLARRFAVNRHTLRRALDELMLKGRVLRRQGKGTQVLEVPTIYPMGVASAHTESLSARGHRAETRLLETRQHPAGVAEAIHLGIDEGGQVLGPTTLRYLDGQPVSLVRHCYAVSRSGLLADYQDGSLRRYLADKGLPLTHAYSLIGARPPNHEEAARLLTPHHTPLLTVLTLPRDRTGQPMELAQSISRANRFQYQVAPQEKPMTALHSDLTIAARQRWTGVLARARREELDVHADALRDADYHLLRTAETGMTLVRGRMGGTGSPLNLGEITMTRCVIRLTDGRTGYSYVTGRDKRHAELAALADAHPQGVDAAAWQARPIKSLARTRTERRAVQEAEIATTKMEFSTLVRGED